jgi:hypothetical protein
MLRVAVTDLLSQRASSLNAHAEILYTMDHSTMMTASGSNSSTSDDFCTGTGRVMLPGFQLASDGGPCILFLFQDAVVDTKTRYAMAVLGTFVLAITVELLRWSRAHVSRRDFRFTVGWGEGSMDLALFVLYTTQMCLAYWLMLLVMLYEYAIFIAIVVGLGVGLVVARRLDLAYYPAAIAVTAGGTPCCDGHCGDIATNGAISTKSLV